MISVLEPKSCLDVKKKYAGIDLISGMYDVWINETKESVFCKMDDGKFGDILRECIEFFTFQGLQGGLENPLSRRVFS